MKDSLAHIQCKTRNRLQPDLRLANTRAFRMRHTIVITLQCSVTQECPGWVAKLNVQSL